MVVNFEFLGEESIENVITCMNFQVDKTVFFGYQEVILEQKTSVENFLRKYCGVQQVVFWPLSHQNLPSVLKTMRKEIEQELARDNQIFFDITGGESLILVAFGMLAREYKAPLHMYSVAENKLVELEDNVDTSISKAVPGQSVPLDLDRYIEMRGGKINYSLHKGVKNVDNPEFNGNITKLWEISRRYTEYWNPFSDFLRSHMVPNDRLEVVVRADTIETAIQKSVSNLRELQILTNLLDDLSEAGLLQNLRYGDGWYRFRFKNQDVKDCLWEGGSILELHIFQREKNRNQDCKVGIHLDWDGIIHEQPGMDVLNEIDVLTLNDNIPTFISCKSGKLGASAKTLSALYELQTVAERFGGKYARKVLAISSPLPPVYLVRAKEMGIEVEVL